jgi:hypothetical protein
LLPGAWKGTLVFMVSVVTAAAAAAAAEVNNHSSNVVCCALQGSGTIGPEGLLSIQMVAISKGSAAAHGVLYTSRCQHQAIVIITATCVRRLLVSASAVLLPAYQKGSCHCQTIRFQ